MLKSVSKKLLSGVLALAMVLTLVAVPAVDAQAAANSKNGYKLTNKTTVTAGASAVRYNVTGVKKGTKVTVLVSNGVYVGKTKSATSNAARKITLKGTGKTLKFYVKVPTTYTKTKANVKVTVAKTSSKAKTVLKESVAVKSSSTSEETLSITGITASSAATLTVTGTKLGELSASDFTIDGNTVESYVAAADGKSAVITLGTAITSGSSVSVSVNGQSFTATYTASESSDEAATDITAGSSNVFDSDTDDQYMNVKVDGTYYAANDTSLATAGYTFMMTQTSKSLAGATDLFYSNASSSLSGQIDETVYNGDEEITGDEIVTYAVKVDVYKDGLITDTYTDTVYVKDVDYTVTALDTPKVYVTSSSTVPAGALLTSSTLVIGETAVLGLTGTYNGVAGTVLTNDNATLTSSDSSVLDVDSAGNITAIKAGTATVTVRVGSRQVSKTFTVTSTSRVLTSATFSKTSLSMAVADDNNHGDPEADNTYYVGVTVTDQYGDAVDAETAGNVYFTTTQVNSETIAEISEFGSVNLSNAAVTGKTIYAAVVVGYYQEKDTTRTQITGTAALKVVNKADQKTVGTINVAIAKAPAGTTTLTDTAAKLAQESKYYCVERYNGAVFVEYGDIYNQANAATTTYTATRETAATKVTALAVSGNYFFDVASTTSTYANVAIDEIEALALADVFGVTAGTVDVVDFAADAAAADNNPASYNNGTYTVYLKTSKYNSKTDGYEFVSKGTVSITLNSPETNLKSLALNSVATVTTSNLGEISIWDAFDKHDVKDKARIYGESTLLDGRYFDLGLYASNIETDKSNDTLSGIATSGNASYVYLNKGGVRVGRIVVYTSSDKITVSTDGTINANGAVTGAVYIKVYDNQDKAIAARNISVSYTG